MSIPNLSKNIKGWVGRERKMLVLLGILCLVAGVSFYIGYTARAEMESGKDLVRIDCPAEAYLDGGPGSADRSGITPPGVSLGSFVASRNGTRYYPITCTGAARINESNKIWFMTEEEALAAGYTRATTCVWK